jgi:DNA-binding response OmpR family regulator
MHILTAILAEADPQEREQIASSLHGGGFSVLQIMDLHEMMSTAGEQEVDVILLDLNLPDSAAWTIIQALQAQTSTCEIPVIALSSTDMLSEASRLLNAGFCGYLTKPVTSASLLAAIRYCLARTAEGAEWVDLSPF